MVSPDGRFLPPLELNDPWISALPGHNTASGKQDFSITPLRMKNSHVWLLDGANLLEVDCETGKLVKQRPLPNFNASNASTRKENDEINSSTVGPISEIGFNYIASGHLYHAGFDGVTKDLGPARLE